MKYHNFKRSLAIILASLLTFSSATFVASAQTTEDETQGTTTITYTLSGEKNSNGDYVVNVTAVGGLINTGMIEINYPAEIYDSQAVEFTVANGIKDADFYWNINETIVEGTLAVGFMSGSGADAGLFAEDNESNTIAYIDATKEVNIGTFTLPFKGENTYESTFTTDVAESNSVTIGSAKYILHDKDGYDTTKHDADIEESIIKVFSAKDFTVEDTETTYNGNAQEPTVTSDVAEAFTLDLDGAIEQTDAGTYAIKVKNVSGEGYYDAAEIDLAKNFVIQKKEVTITAPVADPVAAEYVPNGFDPADITLSSEDWEVTDTALLNVGVYNVNVKYVGEFDTDNNIYKFNDAEVTNKEAIVATVAFEVTKAEGEVPALTTTYEATYDSTKDQTVTGYGVELSEDWEWVNANSSLSIGDNKDIAVKFVPEDVANYTYAGYDETLGYVPGKVTVTLNKADGVAPTLPTVSTEPKRLESYDTEDQYKVSNFVADAGVWSYTDEVLNVGDTNVTFTYKPDDQDEYDYSELANWNDTTKQFEYTVKLTVQQPYFNVTVPGNPAALPFQEATDEFKGYLYSMFVLSDSPDWNYTDTTTKILSAGDDYEAEIYMNIPAGYDVPPSATGEYTVSDGKIYAKVTLTISKIDIPADSIKFAQTSDYTGNAITLNKDNITITGLTGVTEDDVTLVAVAEVNAGTYDVLATVAETTNYNAVTTAVKIGTLTISPSDVTADKFTLEYKTVEYDGNAKKPTVTATAGVGAVATVKYYGENGDEVAEPKEVGTYTVKVSGPANGNYKAYPDLVIGTFNITKHQITINKPADPTAVNYTEGGFDVKTLTFTDWTVTDTAALNAGTHTVNIKYTGTLDTENNTYLEGEGVTKTGNEFTATVSLTVNKIALPADAYTAEKVETSYDGNTKEITVVAGKYTGVGTYTVAYTPEAPVNAGTYSATITVAEGDNYLAGVITLTDIIVISKAIVAKTDITVGNTKHTYDGSKKTPTATSSKGGTAVVTVTGEAINAGTYTFTVSGEATTNYEAYSFEYVNELVIDKANVTKDMFTVTNNEHKYDENAKEATVTVNAGVGAVATVKYYDENGDEVAEPKKIGTYTVKVSGPATDNYNEYTNIELDTKLTISKGKIVIQKPESFDDVDYVEGGFDLSTLKMDGWTTISTQKVGAGKHGVTVKYAGTLDTDNYEYEFDGATVTSPPTAYPTIIVRKINLPADPLKIDDNDFTYNGSAQKATVSLKNTLTGVGTITVTYKQGETVVADPTDAGTYDVYATVATGNNYYGLAETKIGSYEIKKATVAQTEITVSGTEHTYDGSKKTPTATSAKGGTAVVTVTGEAINAGTYTFTVSGEATTNYEAYSFTYENGLEIKKADVKESDFTVSDKSQPYDGSKKAPTVAKVTAGIGDPTITIDEVINAGKYTFTVSGLESENYNAYSFEYENGFEITAAELKAGDFTVEVGDYTFDNTAKKPNVTTALSGVGTITVTYKQNGEVVADPTNAGTYDVYVTVEAGTNYAALDETKVGSFEIKKATLDTSKINFTQTATYNGSAVALDNSKINVDASLVGVTAADVTIAFKDATEAVNAGEYAVVATVKATTNYAAVAEAFEIGKLTINKADVKETDFTVSDKSLVYDGEKKAPKVTKATEGIGEPTITIADAINVGKYTFTVSGPASENYNAYSFEYTEGFEITKRTITIAKPENIGATNYTPGGINAAYIAYPENWAYNDEVDKMLEAGVDQAIKVKYTATLDTANNDYVAGEGVEGNANDGFTSIVTITVNQIAGTIPALTTSYEATYNKDIADKKVTSYITIADAKWTLTDADAVLEYKADNKYAVETVLDTKNYTYAAVDGVTVGDGKATAEITVKFNKAVGTVTAPTAPSELTYDNGKSDKKVTTYIASFGEGWSVVDADAVLAYGDNTITVKYTADTENYTWDGYTVENGYITTTVAVKFNKATLPTDAAIATSKTVEYDGNDHTVDVVANDNYKGLGTFNVVYHEGYTDAGVYDITVNFAEGENYKEGSIVIADILTITKQVLQNISGPTFNQTEAIVGDVISGDAGEGFTFVESYTIKEGDNEIKVTKTIVGSFAKNYDYTEAAAKVGLTVTIDETTGDVTLSKTFNVTGKYSTGTLNLTVNTDSAQTADANTGDVTITILPEGGTAYELATDKFTESADVITVADLVLTEGKYTITVKKQRYLAYVLTLNVTANSTTEKTIDLVAGDIVGGEAGKEVMGDGVIDIDDFVIAIRAFDEASSTAVKSAADIDESSLNNVTDLGFIKANFNKSTAGNCTEDTTIANG